MATTTNRLMTFAEFEQIPDTPEGFPYELRCGELIKVAPPKMDHSRVQWRLRDLLDRFTGSAGVVVTEMGFRALNEHEYRVADVAFLTRERWDSAKDYIFGTPELVVEVLSPSNTTSEMADREKLCLANGAKEFWVVDIRRKLVNVSTPDGKLTYRTGQRIPGFFSSDASISVDSIFAD